MPVAAPADAYAKMIAYGQKKTQLRLDQLALQSCLAGFWVAVYGHALTYFSGQFFVANSPYTAGLTKLVYGVLFPGAFVAVIYTGTELFTGNTVTMIMYAFHGKEKKGFKDLVRIWSFSLVGNCMGAVLGAFFFSYLSSAFKDGQPRDFLYALAESKTGRGFIPNLMLGIGCNSLVCLATWCVVCSDDGAGKILAIFYSIAVFSVGGFEHIVANFYTLSAASMCGYTNHSFWEIMWRNWLPVLIGNLLAGTLLTGTMWWYVLHPKYTELSPFTNNELAHELDRRHNTATFDENNLYTTEGEVEGPRWRQGGSVSRGPSFLLAHHLVPARIPSHSSRQTSYSGTTVDHTQIAISSAASLKPSINESLPETIVENEKLSASPSSITPPAQQ